MTTKSEPRLGERGTDRQDRMPETTASALLWGSGKSLILSATSALLSNRETSTGV